MSDGVDGQVGRTVDGSPEMAIILQMPDGHLRMGDLLVCSTHEGPTLLQVHRLEAGVLTWYARKMVGGTTLAGQAGVDICEPGTPSCVLAGAKPLYAMSGGGHGGPIAAIPASTPVRRATPEDLSFMEGRGPGRLYLGQVRSGSRTIPGDGFWIDAGAVPHHILVAGASQMGASNFVKCMLWRLLGTGGVGMLVLDRFGKYRAGLSAHPMARERLACYTPSSSPRRGAMPLSVNVRSVRPNDLRGMVKMTGAQDQMMSEMYDRHGSLWIERLGADALNGDEYKRGVALTRANLHHKVRRALDLDSGVGVFVSEAGVGEGTVPDIMGRLDAGQVVVVDTSSLFSKEEDIMENVLVGAVLHGRRRAENDGRLGGLPPVGIAMKADPDLLLNTNSAYYRIVRGGQNFKVGVVAVTHNPSMMRRDVLAGFRTKIIFGYKNVIERRAVIESAPQDLSKDYNNMASLNPGEAMVSSLFAPFTVPIRVPLFDDLAGNGREADRPEQPGEPPPRA